MIASKIVLQKVAEPMSHSNSLRKVEEHLAMDKVPSVYQAIADQHAGLWLG